MPTIDILNSKHCKRFRQIQLLKKYNYDVLFLFALPLFEKNSNTYKRVSFTYITNSIELLRQESTQFLTNGYTWLFSRYEKQSRSSGDHHPWRRQNQQ